MLIQLKNCLKLAEFLFLERYGIVHSGLAKTIKGLQCRKREENRLKNGCWKVEIQRREESHVFEDDGEDVTENEEKNNKKMGKMSLRLFDFIWSRFY